MSFKAAAAIRKVLKRKKKEPAAQKQDMSQEHEKEEISSSKSFSERIAGWQVPFEKLKKYHAVIMRAIRGILRIDHCRVRLALCFDNPELTGKIVGLIFSVNSFLPKTCSIQPVWDFSKKLFYGECAIKLTFRQYLFWWYLVKLFFFIRKKSEDSAVYNCQVLKTQEA